MRAFKYSYKFEENIIYLKIDLKMKVDLNNL